MDIKSKNFQVGQVVDYVETWPNYRIICQMTIKTVGKTFVTTEGHHGKFRLDGTTTEKGVYKWRAIVPKAVT